MTNAIQNVASERAFASFRAGVPRWSRHVAYSAWGESDVVLSPFEEWRIIGSSIEGLERVVGVSPSFAMPQILDVSHFERPRIRGELDVPLAAHEEVHVFDALTGEDLGAAIVDHREWALEDSRVLSDGQIVVYVARVIDANGNAGELSNACDFVVEHPSPGTHARNADELEGFAADEASDSTPSSFALITDVASECRERAPQARRRPGDSKMSKCRRILSGTLSEPLRAGDMVRVFDGAIDLGRASVRGNTWTFCDERILRIGTSLSYTAHVANRYGILGPISSIYMMTVGEAGEADTSGLVASAD